MKNMPVGVETIKTILGINRRVDLTPSEMAKNLKVTFFPHGDNVDQGIIKFSDKLENAFNNLGVGVVAYNEALELPSLDKIFKRWFLFFKIYSLVVKSLELKEEIAIFKKLHCKKFIKFVFGKKIWWRVRRF